MEGPEIQSAEAVIDNGRYGQRVVRFETGLLAQQAAGSTLVSIDDDTTLLSTTAVGKKPREGFDFFPLTVDVEERMYADGRIPGSFFRREGRPSTDAILTCRLIDRPLRPAFVKGIRNEVQVVVTVTSIAPDEIYDTVAINAASLSTQLSGLPFSGPVGGVRLALMAAGLPEPDLQIELWDPDYSLWHPASADLGYRRWRIAIHYEGKTHDGAAQVGKDTRRDAVFLRQGWLNIRVAGTDRWRGFVETAGLVRAAIAERGGLDAGGAEDRLRN